MVNIFSSLHPHDVFVAAKTTT